MITLRANSLLSILCNCLIAFTFSIHLTACKTMTLTTTTDPVTGNNMLLGNATFKQLYNDDSYPWLKEKYMAYKPDSDKVKYIGDNAKGITFIVFGGTWCSDTRALLPNFYKVLHAAGINDGQTDLYLLDRSKKAADSPAAKYNIEYLPTFVVLKDDKEIGRVVEYVEENIEQDLVKILTPK